MRGVGDVISCRIDTANDCVLRCLLVSSTARRGMRTRLYATGDYRVCANWHEDSRVNRVSIDGANARSKADRSARRRRRPRHRLVSNYPLIMAFGRLIGHHFVRDDFTWRRQVNTFRPIRGCGIAFSLRFIRFFTPVGEDRTGF